MSGRGEHGFTLFELLVVLAVLSLVLAVGLPRLVSALPGTETRRSASDLAATLKDARFLAIRRNVETAVVLDLAGRRYAVAGTRETHNLPSGLEVAMVVAGAGQADGRAGRISFYPDGSSSGGRISLSQGTHRYHVDVAWLTGRVRVTRR